MSTSKTLVSLGLVAILAGSAASKALRLARPPGPSAAGLPGALALQHRRVFAITKLYFGNAGPDGTASTSAWKGYGYDIDGKVSEATSTNLCQPRNNAPIRNVYPDGVDGTDNAFGKLLLPIVMGGSHNDLQPLNAPVSAGKYTLLIDIPLDKGSDANSLSARAYQGAAMAARPKLDGTDAWPVAAASLTSPADIASARMTFPGSYLTGNTWVSGAPMPDLILRVGTATAGLDLHITRAVITMQLDAAHRHATRGVISGILVTDQLVEPVRQLMGSYDPTLCSGPTFDSILAQVIQASDIGASGGQDPSYHCAGISIGLGFDAELVTLGPIVPSPPPTAAACPPR